MPDIDINLLGGLHKQLYDPVSTSIRDENIEHLNKKEFRDGDIAEIYHENTKLIKNNWANLGRTNLFLKNDSIKYAQKMISPDYRGKKIIELPEAEMESDVLLSQILSQRRSKRQYTGEGISLNDLATLLKYGCGVNWNPQSMNSNGKSSSMSTGRPLRTYPSGGGLYPVETYFAVVNGSDDLTKGLYYYNPNKHAIRVLEQGRDDFSTKLSNKFHPTGLSGLDYRDTAVIFLLTGSFWRSKAKYGSRGYRYVLQESGHLSQNLLLVAQAMGLGATPIGGCYEDKMESFLGINGVDESLIYINCVGIPEEDYSDD